MLSSKVSLVCFHLIINLKNKKKPKDFCLIKGNLSSEWVFCDFDTFLEIKMHLIGLYSRMEVRRVGRHRGRLSNLPPSINDELVKKKK